MTKPTKPGDTRSLSSAGQLGRSVSALAYLRDGKTQSETAKLTGLSRFTVNKLAQSLAANPDYAPTQAKRGRKPLASVLPVHTVAATA